MPSEALVLILTVAASVFPVGDSQRGEIAPADAKREFTVSGCLVRRGYAGYQIEKARIEAIDGKSIANPAAPGLLPKKWILEGGGNIGPRVGEQVEVVGRSDWQPESSQSDGDPTDRSPHLEVKSVRTLASECPAP